jgi:hypothetical protein
MTVTTYQQDLRELLHQFEENYPDMRGLLALMPRLDDPVPPFLAGTVVTTGTSTEPTELAYLGSGTPRDH